MKISLLIHSLAGGGAERVVSQFVTYLHERKVDVCLVLMSDIIVYDIPDDITIYYLENTNLKESGLFKLIKLPYLAYRYRSFLKRENITVSLSFLNRPNYVNLLAKLLGSSVKTYVSERSNPSAQYGSKSIHSRINSLIIKKLFPKADGIIANSKGNGLELILNFDVPEYLITTIHNPIDLEKVVKTQKKEGFYDEKYFNFITVGRLNDGKNHRLLFESLRQVQNERIRLYVFGDGELREYLQELIIELELENQVFLKGFSKEIFTYLKGADSFLFGSNHEGFPNVLIEAMACGLPIITTNCPSGPSEIMEVFSSNEINKNIISKYGILVPVDNVPEMAAAIKEMVNNSDYRNFCKKDVLIRSFEFRKEYVLEQYFEYINNGVSIK
jgi:N-acetylgalactosamine-N,N'-diacetylbacillosaminyl-diphospho-undecaprenol 4-alpha-N-acetylgalactosaminyltransferase